jgi:hypothetical protein
LSTTSRSASIDATRTSATMSNPPLVKARYSTPGSRSSSSRAARHSFCSTLTRMRAAMPWPTLFGSTMARKPVITPDSRSRARRE